MTDDELATIFREGLEHHAASAPTSLDRPVTPRRRLTPWLAAAAAVVVVAGLTALVGSHTDDAGPSPTAPSPSSYDMSGWRTESYGGMSLRVPGDWGLGSVPVGYPGDVNESRVVCDPALTGDRPYVGRPVGLSDMCLGWTADAGPAPVADAVWFASPLASGTRVIDGRTEETRDEYGVRVTVWSDDPQLRTTIFDSSDGHEPAKMYTLPFVDANGCGGDDVPGARATKVGQPLGLSVCVFRDHGLFWSGRLGPEAARRYLDATASESALFDPVRCTPPRDETEVLLGIEGTDGTRWDAVHPGCGRVAMGDGLMAPVDGATVQPWASEAIRLYVPGPAPWFQQPFG